MPASAERHGADACQRLSAADGAPHRRRPCWPSGCWWNWQGGSGLALGSAADPAGQPQLGPLRHAPGGRRRTQAPARPDRRDRAPGRAERQHHGLHREAGKPERGAHGLAHRHQRVLHSTAVGKAYMAALAARTLEPLLKRCRFERYTANTLTDRAALRKELELTRERGWSVDSEENEAGIYLLRRRDPRPRRRCRWRRSASARCCTGRRKIRSRPTWQAAAGSLRGDLGAHRGLGPLARHLLLQLLPAFLHHRDQLGLVA
jgi:hypothetical protein